MGLNPVYVSRTDPSMSRCFTANSSHVWLLSCQRLQEMDDDRKVYIITDLATAGPGPTLGWLISTHLFHTHTQCVWTLKTRSMPEACRASWGKMEKEGQKNRNYVKEEMWQDILKLVDVEEQSVCLVSDICGLHLLVQLHKVHSLQCAAATSALF